MADDGATVGLMGTQRAQLDCRRSSEGAEDQDHAFPQFSFMFRARLDDFVFKTNLGDRTPSQTSLRARLFAPILFHPGFKFLILPIKMSQFFVLQGQLHTYNNVICHTKHFKKHSNLNYLKIYMN